MIQLNTTTESKINILFISLWITLSQKMFQACFGISFIKIQNGN